MSNNTPNNSEPDLVDWLKDTSTRLRYAKSIKLGYTGLHYDGDQLHETFLADGGKPENTLGSKGRREYFTPGNLDDEWNDEVE